MALPSNKGPNSQDFQWKNMSEIARKQLQLMFFKKNYIAEIVVQTNAHSYLQKE